MKASPRNILLLTATVIVVLLAIPVVAVYRAFNPTGQPFLFVADATLVGDEIQMEVVSAVYYESFCCSGMSREFRQFVLRFPIGRNGDLGAPRLAHRIGDGDSDRTSVCSTGFGTDRVMLYSFRNDGTGICGATLYGTTPTNTKWGVIQSWPSIKYASDSGRYIVLDDLSVFDAQLMQKVTNPQLQQLLQSADANPITPKASWQLSDDLKLLISQPQEFETEKHRKIRLFDAQHGYREFPTEIYTPNRSFVDRAGITRGELRFLYTDAGAGSQYHISDDAGHMLHTMQPTSNGSTPSWDPIGHRMLFFLFDGLPRELPSNVRLNVLDYETGEQRNFRVDVADLFALSHGHYMLKEPG